MALKYHPDVRTNNDSTETERKLANDDFARINAAYAFLTGKSDTRPDATESEKRNGSSGNGTGGYGGYTPPHRRSGTERTSSGGAYSTDWKDYMPKYDEEEYDTNGDSFGAIFSDLFNEMSSSAASGGSAGILNDFISFLEGNFATPGTAAEKEEDIILNSLLRDGSLEEIKEELSDAKLLVRQLEQKNMDLDAEFLAVKRDQDEMGSGSASGKSKTFMDGMRLEERKREVEARKDVVGDYLDRARMRQLKLRKRYEELRAESGTRGNASSSSRSSSSASGSYSSSTSSSTASSDSSGRGNQELDDDDAWKRESFGSSRRRRGSGRSRASSTSSSTSSSSSSSRGSSSGPSSSSSFSSNDYSRSSTRTGSRSTSTYDSSTSTSSSPSSSSASSLPPHRRLSTSEARYRRNEADKRRLREIKVDEEIEKMKKELGL